MYKEKKFLEAEKIFKEIPENKKISELKKSWKIEYQIWNTKYKIWEKIENPKKLSDERKMQKIFWKNFDKIIENYQESIANYKLWIKKNNQNKKSEVYKFLDKILKENLDFVEKKLEKIKKEKEKQDKKNWKKPSKWNKKSKEKNQKQPEKNQLNKDDLQKLKNQLKGLEASAYEKIRRAVDGDLTPTDEMNARMITETIDSRMAFLEEIDTPLANQIRQFRSKIQDDSVKLKGMEATTKGQEVIVTFADEIQSDVLN